MESRLRPSGLCENCQKYPATAVWSESPFAAVHGLNSFWCERCVLTTQIEAGEKIAADLPNKKQRLAELLSK